MTEHQKCREMISSIQCSDFFIFMKD